MVDLRNHIAYTSTHGSAVESNATPENAPRTYLRQSGINHTETTLHAMAFEYFESVAFQPPYTAFLEDAHALPPHILDLINTMSIDALNRQYSSGSILDYVIGISHGVHQSHIGQLCAALISNGARRVSSDARESVVQAIQHLINA